MSKTIAIVGLGYVGLPLAHAFATKGHSVLGFDVDTTRINELNQHVDRTQELTTEQLSAVTIHYTADASALREADIVILAIPTPIDANKKPDLTLVRSATETIGANLKEGAIVVYESTVYPGTTEEICGPILEEKSGLKSGEDFFLGYSPERIVPGDKDRTIDKIVKVVGAQDEQTLETLCSLYESIITAGVHRAPNIKTAEMAKAIENAQRDLNIAFINEVAVLCNAIGIDTHHVLDAAGTKWNFLQFEPGLVGGHCIGVDPYYLVEKAHMLGIETEVITAGRKRNDSMGQYVASQVLQELHNPSSSRVLVLGTTFKENVPDFRNSQVPSVIDALTKAGCSVETHDPFDPKSTGSLESGPYDAVLLLVPHEEYKSSEQAIIDALNEGGLIYDLKSILNADHVQSASRHYLSL